MQTGTVDRLVILRGFGFIAPDAGGPDVFFHHSHLRDGLEFDETLQMRRVRFEAVKSDRGLSATEVRPHETSIVWQER